MLKWLLLLSVRKAELPHALLVVVLLVSYYLAALMNIPQRAEMSSRVFSSYQS